MIQNEQLKWYLISIKDQNALNGQSFYNVINRILKMNYLRKVILNDIEGAFTKPLTDLEVEIIDIEIILKLLLAFQQLDCGGFFLFKENLKNFALNNEYAVLI